MPPVCWMVPVQVHPPPEEASVQVTDPNPSPASGPEIPLQVVVVPEICKQPAGSCIVAVPDVVVPSL